MTGAILGGVLLSLSVVLSVAGFLKERRCRQLREPGRCQCQHFECYHVLRRGQISDDVRPFECSVTGCHCKTFIPYYGDIPGARQLRGEQ